MMFDEEEINKNVAENFLAFFRKKYPNFSVVSLTFAVEYHVRDEVDPILGEQFDEIIHMHCSSCFDKESEEFSMDFRSFTGQSFKECTEKFSLYYDGMYKIYLLEQKNNENDS